MLIVLEQILYLLIFAAIGFTLCATKLVAQNTTKLLSTLGVYVFLPATIFRSFAGKCTPDYLKQKYPLILVSIVLVLIVAAIAYVGTRWIKPEYRRKLFWYSLSIANYAYIGYPLAEGLFGADVLFDVLIFALPMSLFTNIVGFCQLTNQKINFKRLLNPPILAAILGVCAGLLGIPMPSVIDTVIANAAGCMAPCCMLLTGMVISEYHLLSLLKRPSSYIVSAMRLLVIPCLIGLVLHLLKLDFAVLPALITYAMPCGMNTIIFPRLIGEDCLPGASMLFISTVLSAITIPLVLMLFQGVI